MQHLFEKYSLRMSLGFESWGKIRWTLFYSFPCLKKIIEKFSWYDPRVNFVSRFFCVVWYLGCEPKHTRACVCSIVRTLGTAERERTHGCRTMCNRRYIQRLITYESYRWHCWLQTIDLLDDKLMYNRNSTGFPPHSISKNWRAPPLPQSREEHAWEGY